MPEVGEMYASNDRRDMEAGHNQRRLVVDVDERWAYFERPGGGKPYRVQITHNGGVKGHRCVSEAPRA